MTIPEICDLLKETLTQKNAAYGNSAAAPPIFAKGLSPDTGVLVRMGDKVSRLENLLADPLCQYDEGIRDTVLDLAGYCVLYLASLKDEK